MDRIPASERTRERLKALMDGHGEKADLCSELVRLGARLIVEEGLEGETADALGREYCAAGAGYRNDYRTGRLRTAEGMIEYALRRRSLTMRCRFATGCARSPASRSEELEALAVEMYARGLSPRDIEALFADERGQSRLSRTAVSEITQRLWAEYEAFASRDLSEFEVIYCRAAAFGASARGGAGGLGGSGGRP
jgi:transposase-like protein